MYRVLGLLLIVFALSEASNILVISTVASHSHSIWCTKLAELLAQRGHNVTLLDTNPPKKKTENLTTYHLEGAYDFTANLPDYQVLSELGTPNDATNLLYEWNNITCRALMFSSTFKKFLNENSPKTKPFDLLIHDITNCENFLGIVHFLRIPKLMGVTAFGEPANVLDIMNNQQNYFLMPYHMSPYTIPMNLIERLKNVYYSLYFEYYYWESLNLLDTYSKEIFGKSTPHVKDIARSTSMVLVNSHPIMEGAKYFSPNIVQIGGFHIDEPSKLEPETQKFLDGAEHGAIYFSLDSNITSSVMSKEKKQIFLNVFKNLKQRVVWKFEDSNITDIPKNVLVSKRFRQNDVLAHPNIKIFISHSGLLNIQEAVYNGVPMVVMPTMIDHHFLSQRLSNRGVAVPLEYSELTEKKLQEAIHLLLTDDRYSTEMKRWSAIFKDRPVKPKDLALYWIEYVLRHDDINFLKTPETFLKVVQQILMSIIMVIIMMIGVFMFLYGNKHNTMRNNKKSRRITNRKYKRH